MRMSRTSSVLGEFRSASGSSSMPTQFKSTSTSVLETIKEQIGDKTCIFCNLCTVDEHTLGPLYARDGVNCHYYCLLFCCNLPQKGSKDTDGILGFLTEDILNEVKRVGNKTSKNFNFYKCKFCKQPGATIGCYLKKCRMVYHFPCGLQNGVNFRFTSKFESYCKAHSGPEVFKPVILRHCPICVESLEDCTTPIVLGKCCSNSNFHKECIQEFALSAGRHHLKCPTCADKDLFIPDVKSQGIFVPEKDADWESPNSFQDLQQTYSRCDAQKCLCPDGRDQNDGDKESIWRILTCSSCAGSAIHVECKHSDNLSNASSTQNWLCSICRDVERRLQDGEDKENRCTNMPPPSDSEDGDEDETPTNARVGDNDFSDDDSSLFSVSSDESLFTACVVKRKVPSTTRQTDEEDFPDNSSVSSGGTLFSVVVKKPSYRNSKHKMHSPPLPSPSEIEEPNAALGNIQDMKEDEGTERSQSPIPNLSLPGSDFDDDEDEHSDFSGDNTSSSGASSSDLSLFIPAEPPRKRIRVAEEVPLPPFKISNVAPDDDNFKEIRCYCERYNDEERLTTCRRCGILFHTRCQAGLFKKYKKSLHTRCCQRCTGYPALKELQEIPISGKHVPKGCENTRSKSYYLTLVHRDDFMVRRHDAVYISEGDNRDVESSRILRVEKLWKNLRGTRFISGHFYYRPSETVNAATRRFYRKEIFRSSTPSKAEIKMDDVLGRCWIMDPVTYCKGRPSSTTLDDEKHIFICESWVDPQTNRISVRKLAQSLHSICMRPDAFKEFTAKMKIKKDYRVEGVTTGKQGSSSSAAAPEGRSRKSARVVDDSIVVLDLD